MAAFARCTQCMQCMQCWDGNKCVRACVFIDRRQAETSAFPLDSLGSLPMVTRRKSIWPFFPKLGSIATAMSTRRRMPSAGRSTMKRLWPRRSPRSTQAAGWRRTPSLSTGRPIFSKNGRHVETVILFVRACAYERVPFAAGAELTPL